MSLEPYQERVVVEKQELDTRLERLAASGSCRTKRWACYGSRRRRCGITARRWEYGSGDGRRTPEDLRIGDVLISSRGTRWTVEGWSPRGKLVAWSDSSGRTTHTSWWWRYVSDVPKNWGLERDGETIL